MSKEQNKFIYFFLSSGSSFEACLKGPIPVMKRWVSWHEKSLYPETDIGAVVEGVVAVHEALGGFEV